MPEHDPFQAAALIGGPVEDETLIDVHGHCAGVNEPTDPRPHGWPISARTLPDDAATTGVSFPAGCATGAGWLGAGVGGVSCTGVGVNVGTTVRGGAVGVGSTCSPPKNSPQPLSASASPKNSVTTIGRWNLSIGMVRLLCVDTSKIAMA